MIKHFISLEWKSLFRSASFGKSIAIKILMVFLAIYFMATFLILGFALFAILKKTFPTEDPFVVLNGVLFFWILTDLMMRFFLQKLPVMSVKPLLTLPIKKSKMVHFVLGKSALSFFNFLPLFAVIPFGFMLVANDYEPSVVITWVFLMIVVTLIINFLNFIIESLSAETELSFLPLIAFTAVLFGLNYFNIVSFSSLVSNFFLSVTENPLLIIIPIALLGALYAIGFKTYLEK